MKFWWKEKRERGRKTNTDRQRHRETRRDTERSGVGRVDSTGSKRHTCIVETGHSEPSETGKESGRKRDIICHIMAQHSGTGQGGIGVLQTGKQSVIAWQRDCVCLNWHHMCVFVCVLQGAWVSAPTSLSATTCPSASQQPPALSSASVWTGTSVSVADVRKVSFPVIQ